MSFGDNLGQLIEASNAELGGGDLEAVPGVGAHCTKLRADLVDGAARNGRLTTLVNSLNLRRPPCR